MNGKLSKWTQLQSKRPKMQRTLIAFVKKNKRDSENKLKTLPVTNVESSLVSAISNVQSPKNKNIESLTVMTMDVHLRHLICHQKIQKVIVTLTQLLNMT